MIAGDELNQLGVIGLLNFHKRIFPSHVAEFLFQKLQYVIFSCKRKNTDILILKMMRKNL